MSTIISIVGRPNVGKSTLFNRIVGSKKAITEDVPGVTRDRNYAEFDYGRKRFILVDTGGFEPSREDNIVSLVRRQIYATVEESSMIIFLLDCKDGILPQDHEIAAILRRYSKPVFIAINKVDSQKREQEMAEFYVLGADKLYPVSAMHGIGVSDLLDDIADMAEEEPPEEPMEGLRVAVVGRPNTGKSSIVNRLLGSDRMIVSETAGTTRDAIDSRLTFQDKKFVLIDTAGIRKKGKISLKVEEYSVARAIRSVERADVINLIIDAQEGPGHQDGAIANLIIDRGKGIVIVVNKWDLIEGTMTEAEYRSGIRAKLPHADFAPILFTSCITGQGLLKILDADVEVQKELERKITTAKLNAVFEEFFHKVGLPHEGRKEVKIFYVNQAKSPPPTFLLFANYPELVPEHYKRYLENSLRHAFGFAGAPIRLVFKKR